MNEKPTRKPKPTRQQVVEACRQKRPQLVWLMAASAAHRNAVERQRAEIENDDEAQQYQRLLNAHHEASHGYLCWALGVPLISISVVPDSKGRAITRMDPAFFANDKPDDPAMRESVAIAALGGLQGEWIFDNDCSPFPRTRDNEVAFRMLRGTVSERQAQMMELDAKAQNILLWQWPTVEALAVELFKKAAMTGAEVAEFLERRAGIGLEPE